MTTVKGWLVVAAMGISAIPLLVCVGVFAWLCDDQQPSRRWPPREWPKEETTS